MQEKPSIYFTISEEFGPMEFKEKGSKFISYLYPVSSREAAEKKLSELRKEFYDSTHVCYAYRLGEGIESYSRSSDDGEPSGTAGLPILNEIKGKEYFKVLVASIRYYGGTKLGTGGLIKAYSNSAKIVLEVSDPVQVQIKDKLLINVPFNMTGEIMQVINRFGIEILSQNYLATGTEMSLACPVKKTEEADKMLFEITKGKLNFQK